MPARQCRRAEQFDGFLDLARIANLSLRASTTFSNGRDPHASLTFLKEAVELTKPWLHHVEAELEHHGHAAGVQRAPVCANHHGHLLAEMPSLMPVIWKLLTASRVSRKADHRRLGLLRTLHDVLEKKIEEAMTMIERVEARRWSRVRKGEKLLKWERDEAEHELLRISGNGGQSESRALGGAVPRGSNRVSQVENASSRSSARSSGSSSHVWRDAKHQGLRPHADTSRASGAHPKEDTNHATDNSRLVHLTPEQRLAAKKKALTRYHELKRQAEAITVQHLPPPSTLRSGSTQSIPRSPPLPNGVYVVSAQDMRGWAHIEQNSTGRRYREYV